MRILLTILFFSVSVFATQIKEIVNTVGVRDNQLIGYGLVVGLNGSGDGTSNRFTLQSVSNLLQGMNIKVDPNDIKSKNTAAVMVTARIPAFAKSGDKLDVTVSSMGDAKSLQGGTLLLTALRGIDGEIYAIAQGALSIGGLSARPGGAGSHPNAASVINGANVEREINQNFSTSNDLTLSLKNADFKTAHDIERIINTIFDDGVAVAVDSRTIKLNKPDEMSSVEFMAMILEQDVAYKPVRKVIIDEKTGTVIAGVDVEVEPVLITHKDITIKVEANNQAGISTNEIDMKDGGAIDPASNTLRIMNEKTTVANIARMLNKLGASPNDIISIMENLKRVGAFSADLEVI
ncbi:MULTISPECIES: flagellar basal body P-ring protein FlgI [unclassified Campylobacter]|uniref:flagellar basal body P-ring protein FlgI n=1 Tax=unclassified Campylobacter TaxID=2593542 RepID=UPI001237C647|nr:MULTISPECIES: flagellar basal body P-ring protein FlgI [unclassified Campylobacter]KAA6227151.1 flagellar basal body P-ring protein FlgI [Campylobacter sp. LR185c]KAA6227452.1 flagellar basal body P-ring protein FlgI [Campylobacter sp. LR196d]KAA6228479.1 flagellar basal body P-ring protein FlgI [Campylobacter sp. LR286c]KAA6230869.1 flagellar basal body P-ring protein FlgI [Campylobacter sp. LR291e]KAA6233504.1 flagellar basal body P-ring protein FlgI [Campylobacter sp. LR264d]